MDLSYTDTSFHPIYSLQGISQSVLEVTVEMKQKTLFKYYYLLLWIMNYVMNYIILLLWLWKATSFNLCKRDDVFEPPYYFQFFYVVLTFIYWLVTLLFANFSFVYKY